MKNKRGNLQMTQHWAGSCNNCCRGKAINITYSKCVFIDGGIQHAMSMRHIVICGLPGSTVFFYII
jgi:hypothetical protein